MAEKNVKVMVKSPLLSRRENGVKFSVKDGGGQFGELIVSKGGLYWRPENKQKSQFVTWQKFHDFMLQDGRKR